MFTSHHWSGSLGQLLLKLPGGAVSPPGRNRVIPRLSGTPMVRTIWVALFCLGVVSTIASVRFVSSAFGYVVTGAAIPSAQLETTSTGLNVNDETFAKTDRLPVNIELASFEPATVAPIKIDPVVMRIQTEFFQTQLQALTEQSKSLSEKATEADVTRIQIK